jgi:hypothetical protein
MLQSADAFTRAMSYIVCEEPENHQGDKEDNGGGSKNH